jgi:hypothetical protein
MVPKEYGGGILVVFMIGLSKYFDLILGIMLFFILNIIAQFYFLGVILVFLTVGLNMIFIPILGSVFATLLSITLYSLANVCCQKAPLISFY